MEWQFLISLVCWFYVDLNSFPPPFPFPSLHPQLSSSPTSEPGTHTLSFTLLQ